MLAHSTSEEAHYFIFHWKGIWLLSTGSSPYQTHVWLVNRQLAALQAPHGVPGWAERGCDTDPTPITPALSVLIAPSITLTSIYILFETSPLCLCVYLKAVDEDVHHVDCVCVFLCVHLYSVSPISLWMRHLLYCLLLTWIPLALNKSQQEG